MSGYGIIDLTYDDSTTSPDSGTSADQLSPSDDPESTFDWTPAEGDDQFDRTPPPAPLPNDPGSSLTMDTAPLVAGGVNVIPHSSFESSRDWYIGSGWTVPYLWASAFHGLAVARCVSTGVGSELALAPLVPVDRTRTHWASFEGWMPTWTSGSGRVLLREFDATGLLLQESIVGEQAAASTGWVRFARKFTALAESFQDVVWHPETVGVRLALLTASVPSLDWRVDALQLVRGDLDATYAPAPGEDMHGTEIVPGSTPASAFDQTPPGVPVDLMPTTDVLLLADGSTVVRILVSLTHPTDSDYFGSEVEATGNYVQPDDTDPSTAYPIWSNVLTAFLPRDGLQAVIPGAVGGARYWVRARSQDVTGNRSAYSASVGFTAVGDQEAPPIPQSVDVGPILRGLVVSWAVVGAPDIDYYEVRVRATGAVTSWDSERVRATVVALLDLVPDISYDVQVRAVDTSGNVAISSSDNHAVSAVLEPEAGWSAVVTGTPVLVGSSDIYANAIHAVHLLAGEVTADKLGAGYIAVRTTLTGIPDGFRVLAANGIDEIARWDENGLMIKVDGTSVLRHVKLRAGGLYFTSDGGDEVTPAGTYAAAVTPDGINASQVTFGALPGGVNLITNSGFELNAYVAAALTHAWDVTADFTGSHPPSSSLVNLTEGNSLSMTAASY